MKSTGKHDRFGNELFEGDKYIQVTFFEGKRYELQKGTVTYSEHPGIPGNWQYFLPLEKFIEKVHE